VATSSIPGGWNVTYSADPNTMGITVPTSASAATGYEARYKSGAITVSVIFDVLAPATVPVAMGPIPVPINGTDTPANSAIWDIELNGAVIANTGQPNGWTVLQPVNNTIPTGAPYTAAQGSGYEVRYYQPSQPGGYHPGGGNGNPIGPYSGTFSVINTRIFPIAGTKSIVEANGARVTFTAASVPTANQPTVICSVQAGAPMEVTWNYSASSAFGTYTITFSNRTKWVTTTPSQFINAPVFTQNASTFVCYSLSQLVDRNGNAILFSYGLTGPSGFPLLNDITDGSGVALLSFNRATNGTGNITSITDRYGRSVYYQEASFATSGVQPPYPQMFQELTHVSQVEPTGTGNPPDRFYYQYADVTNAENESVPVLHYITVPSPTGTGTSMATLNFNSGTGYASSIVDGNGNTHSYNFATNGQCQVTITNTAATLVTSYTAGFEPNMSVSSLTNGKTNANGQNTTIIYSATYADPNDPYRPSEVLDGNGYAVNGANGLGKWLYTWDQYGNCQTATNPTGP